MFSSFYKSKLNKIKKSDEGFSTAEWVVLMGFTIIILAMMVQGLYIENVRATTISTLRDSAKVGAREADLESVFGTGSAQEDDVIRECENRIVDTLTQVTSADTSDATCVIGSDVGGFYVEARAGNSFENVHLLPGAQIFNGRIANLKAKYYPTADAS